jgi:DnaJ-class molecular chaperone
MPAQIKKQVKIVNIMHSTCKDCKGTGDRTKGKCQKCAGTGEVQHQIRK